MQNKTLIIFAVSSAILFVGNTSDVFAVEQSTIINPKIITNGDLYIESKTSIQIPFMVTATDSFNNPIPVECDKTPNTMFKIGKTTVRCIAVDSFGNEARNSFVITVGYEIVQIPNWIKQITQFWTSGNISDTEYFQTLNFLLDKQIIHVPHTKTLKYDEESKIPIWIKTIAEKWTKGEMSDDEFSIGIQWMLDRKII
ncbi:MAG: HYR domain-containing protein [Nitrosopumilus sp.]|nr:HYR domain-containing protein [Nitrosopumilus sp.]